MAKNLKLTIKNTQIAEAINLGSLKSKLAKKKQDEESPKDVSLGEKAEIDEASKGLAKEELPRVKARTKSVFSESSSSEVKPKAEQTESKEITEEKKQVTKRPQEKPQVVTPPAVSKESKPAQEETVELKPEVVEQKKTPEAKPLLKETPVEKKPVSQPPREKEFRGAEKKFEPQKVKPIENRAKPSSNEPVQKVEAREMPQVKARPRPSIPVRNIREEHAARQAANVRPLIPQERSGPTEKLGPTGKHMRDLIPPPKPVPPKEEVSPHRNERPFQRHDSRQDGRNVEKKLETDEAADKSKAKPRQGEVTQKESEEESKKNSKVAKAKEFRDVKPTRKADSNKSFDVRDRQGLRTEDERSEWRRRKHSKQSSRQQEDTTIRPTALKVRVPISIKDLAVQMKLKSSQLISKLFLQGMVMTLNDLLDDEVVLHMLGSEFGCELTIDSSEEERIRITDKSVKEEILATDPSELSTRPPVVAFMGHVDHGKTSLIDYIRKSNRAAGEAGAITQHIGAFRCQTNVGTITVLDTPGHEAFSAMRARGADVTDIVVLVVAGDEGIRQQTIEAIHHAKAAKVTIVVAINKCDKPNFNAENVYRQLAEQDLLPEAWGGQIITVNCSATTGQGIPELLDMLALQSDVLELKASENTRARGTVLESEMHKGMGAVATVLVQNGTLKLGDSIVFSQHFGRVKTIQNEFGEQLKEAPPSTPVSITGLSGLPEAGQEFIAVKSEKEAREISEARILDKRESVLLLKKKLSVENLLQQSSEGSKKILNVVLRADVQGSLEALKVALQKIESDKAELNIIFTGVGEISESDVQLAAASKAIIIGFHTSIESHADSLVKQLGIQVRLHDIIYHAIDDVKDLMAGLLDKIAIETDKGKAEVRATFKSSQHGIIAGCYVTEGVVQRNNLVRVMRGKEMVHKGQIASLKRVKEDVREVLKGLECGIILNNFQLQEGDILEAYEITYIKQNL